MRHYAKNHPGLGPIVIQRHGALGPVVLCECLTMQAANFEAMRLNSQDMALEHIRQRDALRRIERQSHVPRRSVRYFENEDVHG